MIVKIYKIPSNEEVIYNLGLLLEKLCQSKKIGIFCDEANVDHIDRRLWTFSTNAFVPHDIAVKEHDNIQPILLANEFENINREILCVFNNKDLFSALEFCQNNPNNIIENVVYMTAEKDLDVSLIKKEIEDKKLLVGEIEFFEKNKNKWDKSLL